MMARGLVRLRVALAGAAVLAATVLWLLLHAGPPDAGGVASRGSSEHGAPSPHPVPAGGRTAATARSDAADDPHGTAAAERPPAGDGALECTFLGEFFGPVEGVEAELFARSDGGAERSVARAVSGQDGAVRLGAPPAGVYRLVALHPWHEPFETRLTWPGPGSERYLLEPKRQIWRGRILGPGTAPLAAADLCWLLDCEDEGPGAEPYDIGPPPGEDPGDGREGGAGSGAGTTPGAVVDRVSIGSHVGPSQVRAFPGAHLGQVYAGQAAEVDLTDGTFTIDLPLGFQGGVALLFRGDPVAIAPLATPDLEVLLRVDPAPLRGRTGEVRVHLEGVPAGDDVSVSLLGAWPTVDIQDEPRVTVHCRRTTELQVREVPPGPCRILARSGERSALASAFVSAGRHVDVLLALRPDAVLEVVVPARATAGNVVTDLLLIDDRGQPALGMKPIDPEYLPDGLLLRRQVPEGSYRLLGAWVAEPIHVRLEAGQTLRLDLPAAHARAGSTVKVQAVVRLPATAGPRLGDLQLGMRVRRPDGILVWQEVFSPSVAPDGVARLRFDLPEGTWQVEFDAGSGMIARTGVEVDAADPPTVQVALE